MNDSIIRNLAGKLRNLFSVGKFVSRDSDGILQVETNAGKVLNREAESFPYGYIAKATAGKVIILAGGGNFDSYKVLPVLKGEDVSAPELEDNDVALYTVSGARIVLRDGGKQIYIGNGDKDLCTGIENLGKHIRDSKFTGSPAMHQMDDASKQLIENDIQYIKSLLGTE